MESHPRRPQSASGRSGERSSRDEQASIGRSHAFFKFFIKKSLHVPLNDAESKHAPPHHVPLMVVVVFDDEDHVKTGQDGWHEVDVVLPLRVVPAAEHRVGGGQHGAARVQGGGDARLQGVVKV